MNVTIEKIAEKLKQYKDFTIVYHIRPDGDCIGSAFALALALKSIGARCAVKGRDDVPEIYKFMTENIILDSPVNPVYISVDTSTPKRTGNYQNEHFTFCIDHHRDNSIDADYKYVEEDCGACSEIVLKIIKTMKIEITKDIANLLFTALVTDTNCFRTSDTNKQSFETAAELAGLGADTYDIARRYMFIKSPERLKLEKKLSDSFHFTCDMKIVTGIITLNDLKTADILDSALEGINSMAEQIEGVRIAVTIRELPDKRTRCSIRTNGNIFANQICALYGGGGHSHAASCELDANTYEARKIMEDTCKKFLENIENN